MPPEAQGMAIKYLSRLDNSPVLGQRLVLDLAIDFFLLVEQGIESSFVVALVDLLLFCFVFVFHIVHHLLIDIWRHEDLLDHWHERTKCDCCEDDCCEGGSDNKASFSESTAFFVIWNLEDQAKSDGSSDHATIGDKSKLSKSNISLLRAEFEKEMGSPDSKKSANDDDSTHPADERPRPLVITLLSIIAISVCKNAETDVSEDEGFGSCSENGHANT